MLVYKVVTAKKGFVELEKEVSLLLNKGWRPVGGVAFNNGYPYQAMVGKKVTTNQSDKVQESEIAPPSPWRGRRHEKNRFTNMKIEKRRGDACRLD